MTNPFKRGSAPGRGQPDYLRPGTFKPRHAKRGGRKRGTPNAFSADYKKAIIEAAHRVGWDANGLLGVIGYFAYVARDYPETFCRMLGSLMEWQELEIGLPEKPRPTVEELDEEVRAYITLRSDERTQPEPADLGSPADRTGRKDRTRRQTERAQPPSTRKRSNSKALTQEQNLILRRGAALGVDRPGRPGRPAHAPRHHRPEGVLHINSGRVFAAANRSAARACRSAARACRAACLRGTFARGETSACRGTHAHRAGSGVAS